MIQVTIFSPSSPTCKYTIYIPSMCDSEITSLRKPNTSKNKSFTTILVTFTTSQKPATFHQHLKKQLILFKLQTYRNPSFFMVVIDLWRIPPWGWRGRSLWWHQDKITTFVHNISKQTITKTSQKNAVNWSFRLDQTSLTGQAQSYRHHF